MPVIKDLIEAAAVKIAGFRRCRLGSHRKTPAFGGPAPRSRHFTMLREDQESRSLNDLWVVQGRLASFGADSSDFYHVAETKGSVTADPGFPRTRFRPADLPGLIARSVAPVWRPQQRKR